MSPKRAAASGWDLGLLDRATARRRVAAVLKALRKHYGPPRHGELDDPTDELILTILSQNTNDTLRDKAFATLRERFPTWDDVLVAPEEAVADAIRIGGLSNVKSGRIQKVLGIIKKERGNFDLTPLRDMPVEDARAQLERFKGVGPKTVACVLVFGCGHDVFPVDTHILRISKRLGLIPEKLTLEKAHVFWADACPTGEAYDLHLLLIGHGRNTCHARKPNCDACPIMRHCAYYAER